VKPFLLVLSSPSGGGKTTIAKNLLQARDDLGYSVSATTRPMREG
jgi:guanylate kinase